MSHEPQGLSVLIPVYQTDVKQLVIGLLDQLKRCKVDFEILVYDDASPEIQDSWAYIEKINPAVVAKRMPQNLGRSAIRNLLAKHSRYSHLLFIDADSGLADDAYIEHYLVYWHMFDALCGGTIYEKKCPSKSVSLRWTYGKAREEIPADTRNRPKHAAITLNNFLIRRQLFLDHLLDESITTYGHEDTKLGYLLAKAKATVHHIQNPVFHLGLEPNEVYLSKVAKAVSNFYKLSVGEGIARETSLYQKFDDVKDGFVGKAVSLFFSLFGWLVRYNLLSSKPSMMLLDAYKLNLMLKFYFEGKR